MKNIFQKIIDKEAPADFVYEDESFIVIKDIHPKAPIHLLIIPKKHISTVQEVEEEDLPLMGEMVRIAQEMARKFKIDKTGYRLLFNHGPHSGQIVPHIHLHLMGGAPLVRVTE